MRMMSISKGDHTSIKSSIKNSERIDIKLREKSEVLNWEGLKFPVNLNDINKFENHNSSISVNIFGYEILVYPLKICRHNYKRESTVNLLLISDDTRQHYCYLYKHQNMDMLDMCPLNVLILSIQKNHYHLIMSIVNHTKPYKLNFPKWDRKYLLKITIGQSESHL